MALRPLPSASSARALVRGEASAIPLVLAHLALRAGLIAMGMYAVGVRQNILRASIGGAVGIEAFVLTWEYMQKDERR